MEGILASPLVKLGNSLWVQSVRKKMTAAGVPLPSATMSFAPGLEFDVFDARTAEQRAGGPAPAILYFHAGAFIMGGRPFGAGTASWLAAHGLVGISVTYPLTSEAGARGLEGCIEAAWMALRYAREHAGELGIEPAKIGVMGDSAGGLLALALATGLGSGKEGAPADTNERPAVAVCGWACTTVGSKTFCTMRAADGTWLDTPATKDMETPASFVPEGTGETAEASQRQLQKVFGGTFLLFGRRLRGWLPASIASRWPTDDAASVSPLSRAAEPGLPPTLLLVGGSDAIVPAGQQLLFAERARGAGNSVGALVFEGANHGVGGANSAAGRAAILRFLQANALLEPASCTAGDSSETAGEEFLNKSVEVFGTSKDPTWSEYDVAALDAAGDAWLRGTGSVTLPKANAATLAGEGAKKER